MDNIIRFIVVFLALMVFGSFANFAQNEWGNTIIVVCQAFIACLFLVKSILVLYTRIKQAQLPAFNLIQLGAILITIASILLIILFGIKSDYLQTYFVILLLIIILGHLIDSVISQIRCKKELKYNEGLFESFYLFICFFGLLSKNLFWTGASLYILLGVSFLSVYYLIKAVSFIKNNFRKGKAIVSVLSLGSLAAVFSGYSLIFKIFHWPYTTVLFYIASAFTIIMAICSLKWRFSFDNNSIVVPKALFLLKTNVVLVYFMTFSFCFYKHLVSLELAPHFYSQKYPTAVEKLRDGTEKGAEKSNDLISTYEAFIQNSKIKGFLK